MINKNILILVLTLLLYSTFVKADIGLLENFTWQANLTGKFYSTAAFGDIDKDGDQDLLITGCSGSCTADTSMAKVYINNGTSLIENSTWQNNLTAISLGASALGDIDNDGDLDLILAGSEDGTNAGPTRIYTNNGSSFKENSTWESNIFQENLGEGSLGLGDVDNDGRLDLAVMSGSFNGIYINNGTTFYENTTWSQSLVNSGRTALTWVDLDNDNDLDLVIFGLSNSKVYINNGTTLEENSTWQQNIGAMDRVSLAYGDIDNDGDFDFFASSENACRADIYVNNGTTIKRNSTWENTLTSVFWGGSNFGDYDNSGTLDLAYTGQCGGTTINRIYNNTGTNFSRDTNADSNITLNERGAIVWVDVDKDSDLDLLITGATLGSGPIADMYINNITVSNTAPSPPTSGFSNVFDNGVLTLSWGQGSDTETPANGLYYNIRVGTCQGCNNTVSGIYGGSSGGSGQGGITSGYYGNMMQRRSISIKGLSASTTYNWSVQAIDTALQKGDWSAEQTSTLAADIIDPTITLNTPTSLFNTSNITVIINATINDETNIGNVSLWSNYTGTWRINQTNSSTANNIAYIFRNQTWNAEGTYLWGIEACDGTNNCISSQNRTLTIDLTAPSIGNVNITPGNNSFTSDTTPFVEFNSTDGIGINASSVTIAVNSTVYTSSTVSCSGTTTSKDCSFTLSTALGNGAYNLTFNITDFAGNRGSLASNFTVDTIAPTTNATLTAANDTDLEGNIEISWVNDSSEPQATYRIYRHTSQISSSNVGSASLIYTANNVGNNFEDNTTTGGNATTYWYALVTIDRAGNVNTSAVSNSLSSTANDTVMPLPVVNLTLTGSGATATLGWRSVERDVSGNADSSGMQYVVYYGTDFNGSDRLINDSIRSASTKTVSSNSTTVSVGSTGTWHFAISSLDDGSNENKTFNFSGNYGNVSLTVSADSGSSGGGSGGGGGGGGGGATKPSAGVSSTRVYDILPAGGTAMKVVGEEIAVSELKIDTRSEARSVEISVAKLESPPPVESVSGGVYQYLELTKKNLDDSDVEGVVISFEVKKSWLVENSAGEQDIVLRRFTAKWDELPTRIIGSDDDKVLYEAISPGFSYYAIALKEEREAVEEAAGAKANITAVEPEQAVAEEKVTLKGWDAIVWLMGVIVFVGVLFGLFEFFRHRAHLQVFGKPYKVKIKKQKETKNVD